MSEEGGELTIEERMVKICEMFHIDRKMIATIVMVDNPIVGMQVQFHTVDGKIFVYNNIASKNEVDRYN